VKKKKYQGILVVPNDSELVTKEIIGFPQHISQDLHASPEESGHKFNLKKRKRKRKQKDNQSYAESNRINCGGLFKLSFIALEREYFIRRNTKLSLENFCEES
jgi:hypothetical protein